MAGSALDQVFGNIGNAFSGLGNNVNNFTKPVQQFAQQAQQKAQQIPGVQGAENIAQAVNPINQITNDVHQVQQFVHDAPTYANPNYWNPEQAYNGQTGEQNPNFWNTGAAQVLAGNIRVPSLSGAIEGTGNGPTWGQQANDNVSKWLGGGKVGTTGGFLASLLPNLAESVANVPTDVGQFSVDTARDINQGQFLNNPRNMAADLAELGMPLLTIATLGEGGGIAKSVMGNTGRDAILNAIRGTAKAGGIGGVFGAGSGLESGRNITDPRDYAKNLAKNTAIGAGTGVGLALGARGASKGIRYGKDAMSGAENVPEDVKTGDARITPEVVQQYGADMLSPDGQHQVVSKFAKAMDEQPKFTQILANTAKEFAARGGTNIKDPVSAIGKVIEHRMDGDQNYSIDDVNDHLRGNITFRDKAEIYQALDPLKKQLTEQGYTINGENDYFAKPGPNGYQGYHIDVTSPTGQTSEIQLHTGVSWANAKTSHNLYNRFSDNVPAGVKEQLKHQQTQLVNTPEDRLDVATRADEKHEGVQERIVNPHNFDFTGKPENDQVANDYLKEHGADLSTPNAVAIQAASEPKIDEAILNYKNLKQSNPNLQYDPGNFKTPRLQNLLQQRDDLQSQVDNARIKLETHDAQAQAGNRSLDTKEGIQQENNQLKIAQKQAQQQLKLAQKGTNITPPRDLQSHLDDIQSQIDQNERYMKNYDIYSKMNQGKGISKAGFIRLRQDLNAQKAEIQGRIAIAQAKGLQMQLQPLQDVADGIQQDINENESRINNYDLWKKSVLRTTDKQPLVDEHAQLSTRLKNLDQQITEEQGRIKAAFQPEEKQTPIESRQEKPVTIGQPKQNKIGLEAAPDVAHPDPEHEVQKLINTSGEKPGTNTSSFTGKTIDEYDPNRKLSPEERKVLSTLLEPTSDNYGVGRNIQKTKDAHIDVAHKDIQNIYKAALKELPKESQDKVTYALDDPTGQKMAMLNPAERAVAERRKIMSEVTFDVAKASGNGDLQPVANYTPQFVERVNKNSQYAKAALSNKGPQTQHRIQKFTPTDGGAPLFGRAEDLGLTPSGHSTGVFEDAQGRQHVVSQATLPEKEALGITYKTNNAEITARHLANVFEAKENYGIKKAVTGQQYASMRSAPGKPRPQGFRSTQVQGLEKYGFQKDVAKGLDATITPQQGEGLAHDLAGLYTSTEKSVIRTGLMNPIGHVPNVTGQALFAASKRNPITGVPIFLKNLITHGFGIAMGKDDATYRYYKSLGSNMDHEMDRPAYLTDNKNIIQKASAPLDKVQSVITKPTWKYDTAVKASLYKTLIDQGEDPRTAVSFVDRYVGDYGNLNPGLEKNVSKYATTFYPWLKTEMQPYINAKKYPMALVGGLAWGLGISAAVNAAWQAETGNKDAKLNVIGGSTKLAKDVVSEAPQTVQNIRQGKLKVPPLVLSHVGKPLLRTAVQQGLNYDLLRGKQIADPSASTGDQMKARGAAAAGEINPTAGQAMAAAEGKKSIPEALASGFGFSSTPHLQDYQAAPSGRLNFMNTPNAKQGTGMNIIDALNKRDANLTAGDLQQIQDLKGKSPQDKAKIYAANPKLWDAESNYYKASGQAYDPVYKLDSAKGLAYINNWNGKATADKGAYIAKTGDTSLIQVDRERDAYHQSPSFQQFAQKQGWKETPRNPIYRYNDNQIGEYYKYESMSPADKATYLSTSGTGVIDVARQQNQYHQSKEYQDYEKSQGRTPFPANPIYNLDNNTIATYQTYEGFPAGSAERKAFGKANPVVYQIIESPAMQKYYTDSTQAAWDNRPKGQTVADFAKTHSTVQDVQNNKVIFKPYTPNSGGIQYGSSGSGGYSSYGSTNSADYLQKYLAKEFLYSALNDAKQTVKPGPMAVPTAKLQTAGLSPNSVKLQLKPGKTPGVINPYKFGSAPRLGNVKADTGIATRPLKLGLGSGTKNK